MYQSGVLPFLLLVSTLLHWAIPGLLTLQSRHPLPESTAIHNLLHTAEKRATSLPCHHSNRYDLLCFIYDMCMLLIYSKLLNETRTSPSATPQVSSATLQPLPREPNYDQATYKPPALYPNKRTRTDSGWYGQGADRNAHESTTLPHISTRPEDVTKPRQYDVPLSASASPPSYQYQHSDDGRSRMSNHTSPEIQSRGAQRQPGLLPRPDSVKGFQTEGDRTLLYEPLSATQSRSSSAQLQDEASYRASPYNDRGAAERYPVEPQRQAYPPVSSFAKDYPPTNHEGHGGPTYPYSPAFFVPSHYEYQNGKSRKRSNLPKQSTEIMKRWFDENMQNPYPSEEQKRHFAAVAGINLTQVSDKHSSLLASFSTNNPKG